MAKRSGTPHLFAASSAIALIFLSLLIARAFSVWLLQASVYQSAPANFHLKRTGIAFQAAAASEPNIVLFYGSSELKRKVAKAAPTFFCSKPTGFQVCPIGQAGTTPLIILQKLSALGSILQHRQIIISLSPSWFLKEDLNPDYYLGNFAMPVALRAILNPELSFELKSQMARRMEEFPRTLDRDPVLRRLVWSYAAARPLDRCLLVSLWPLARLEQALFDFQDDLAALIYIRHHYRVGAESPRLGRNNAAPGESADSVTRYHLHRRHLATRLTWRLSSDADFLGQLRKARQWQDLELLLEAANEMQADVLILSMPLDGQYLGQGGVSRSARQAYYDMVRELAYRHRCAVDTFEDHDLDSEFLVAHRDHLTSHGWLCFDDAIDRFFHDPERTRSVSAR